MKLLKSILLVAIIQVCAIGEEIKTTTVPKTTFSLNGLEGFGLEDGITIEIVDYTDLLKSFPKKSFETTVELKLRQAGFKISGPGTHLTHLLAVSALPVMGGESGSHLGYSYKVRCHRYLNFNFNNKEYKTFAVIWNTAGNTPVADIKRILEDSIDEFLLAHIKANPKKIEK